MSKYLVITILISFLSSQNVQAKDADAQFNDIMEAHWVERLRQNPVFATSVGVRDFDERLSDPSLEAYEAEIVSAKKFARQLKSIKTSALSESNRLNHQLLNLELSNAIESSKYGGKYLIMNNRSGPHLNLTSLPDSLPFFTLADYQSYVARLSKMPDYLQKATNRIRAGIESGWVQACAPMKGFEQSIRTHIVEDPNTSVFMEPFKQRPKVVSEPEFKLLKTRAGKLVAKQIIPSFESFYQFYDQEYAPKCRSKVGIDAIEDGDAYYDFLVGFFTTTDASADDVHQVGLSEVARIKAEMLDVIKEAKFEGDFEDWLEYLRESPEFYPKTAEERMQVVATISKKMDGELPNLFGKLPRMPYGLKEIPKDIAEKTTTAYYRPPAGDGSRSGTYFVNTSLLETRPLYQLEALSLHEAVPGHHLQIALAQELELPNFRKYGRQTVFVEGWGLYSERLGLEVGFYTTPYTNFGRLSYEMWRACRLVVDTGLHSKGWTRKQAIDYMAENSGLSMNNITSEVDRYISWPGQALAYKIGELKIRELRKKSEATLGSNFDVRAFHDKVLENGAIPLSVLEGVIDRWLKLQKVEE